MAAPKRLYLYWDPALDGEFRRRLEHALDGLSINASDGEQVDPDPENPGVAMVVLSAAGGWPAPRADIVLQAGPGSFQPGASALRLESGDLEGDTPRWQRLIERLREKLGMASLALPPEDLADRLNAATQRAELAESDLRTARLNEANAIRERDRLKLELRDALDNRDTQARDIERLNILNRSGAFALGQLPEDLRPIVADARGEAHRAELAAASAREAAGRFADVIAWGTSASYSGETRNGRPHGLGIMRFASGAYRGEFANGKRSGHGVGMSDDGLVWSGAWRDDEACGAGVLEAPDGRRFEGFVQPDSDGAPKAMNGKGWTWDVQHTPGRTGEDRVVHRPAPLTLPSPGASAD